jgi:hypothetical protein
MKWNSDYWVLCESCEEPVFLSTKQEHDWQKDTKHTWTTLEVAFCKKCANRVYWPDNLDCFRGVDCFGMNSPH